MENLFDILVPIVFFTLFVLSKLFGPKEPADEDDPLTPLPHRPHQAEDEEEERARLLREEIQRKIAQRRQEAATSATQSTSQPATARAANRIERERASAYNQAEIERKMRQIEQVQQQAQSIRSGTAAPTRGGYERTRRVAATDVRSLGAVRQNTGVSFALDHRSRRSRAAMEARRMVRRPGAMRSAIVLKEILGTPVGFREMEDRSRGAVE